MSFLPNNELEKLMLQAQEDKIGLDEFMNTLVDSDVFMPVKDEVNITDFQSPKDTIPLALQDEKGTNILVIFTSPDRASDFLQDKPDFQSGVVDKLGKLLLKNGVGYGVTINPGEDVGLDFEPDTVEQIVRLAESQKH